MHERAGLIEFRVQQYRLHESKLKQARDKAGSSTSEQCAGDYACEHVLVAGKAGRVTHIMCRVMKGVRLDMSGNEHDGDAH